MSSVWSPEPANTRDPFDLDRLAEELESRSLAAPPSDAALPALPIPAPLSHDDPYLSAETFDVEAFIRSRSYTSLPDLRTELRDYLAQLKEELVKLINDDYEAFISLSTDLRGEGARMERLKAPLGDMKAAVLVSREALQTVQDSIQENLDRRTAIRDEKAFLHLLLKISESITRLESLLMIASPSEESSDVPKMPATASVKPEDSDDRTRGNRAKHLARVAAEYMQLLYHVSRAEKSAFVDASQWRIDRIRATLSSDLDHLFAQTITSLTRAHVSDAERARLTADITECLRTYDSLGLWRDAEDVLRRELIRDFVKKTIHPGALSAPHSPIVPYTPLPSTSFAPTPVPARTPFTPFTPYPVHAPSAPTLDETDDPLAALYNAVLRFVARDLARIMEVAEGVCARSGSRSGPKGAEAGFEVLANVVWAEVGRALMDELGGVVFAAGRPDEFRKHHETTGAFIRSLEMLAPSVRAVEAMRAHPVFAAFERRWQLPVYFQLRWKEIVARLEEQLAVTKLERTSGKEPFVTAQAAATWDAIETCWSSQVYIPELSPRFWKFNLQLLSRYKTWLEDSLPTFEPITKLNPKSAADKTGTASITPSSSVSALPTEAASAESTAADEALLQQLAIAITDAQAVQTEMRKLWRERLGTLLPDTSGVRDENDPSPEDALQHALASIASIVPPLSSHIIAILARRACDALLAMRSIPSQFRAMSAGKRPPSEPSYFVALIFRPLRAFFANDGPGASLKEAHAQAFAEEVFEVVAQRYIYFLSSMKKTEESLRRLKKGKKSAFSLFGASGSARDDDGRADEEKIRTQMILDVEAFAKDAVSLGVAVDQCETFKTLKEMAHAPLTEGKS